MNGEATGLKDLLLFVWSAAYGLTFSLAVGFLIRPKLGAIFKRDIALGFWCFGMAVVTIIWMFSYLAATFWELNIMGATFDPKFNPQFGISHIVLPLIIGFGFSILVAHSWKLHIVFPASIAIGFFDLMGMSEILNGVAEIVVNQAKEGEKSSAVQLVLQTYFLDRSHLQRIVGYLLILGIGTGLAVLSVGQGLFRDQPDLDYLKLFVESNRRRFDRFSRLCFMVAILSNETLIWYWRFERTDALAKLGKPWWF
jgi:hypothetical protein